MTRALALALTTVLAGGILAACGSSGPASQEDYAASIVEVRDRVDFALAQITQGQGTFEELVERMESAADLIDDAAGDLDDAGSAQGFEDETEKLVAAFRQLAAALAATAHDASQPGQEGLLTGTQALQFPGWTKANRVLASLDEQGIAVEPIASH
ncbi:MAG TPA: hypothetical protein VFR32_07710 [Gaiellaceae bacterium]|nr:hypothetical protein [Gaiellaceae bacterium]